MIMNICAAILCVVSVMTVVTYGFLAWTIYEEFSESAAMRKHRRKYGYRR